MNTKASTDHNHVSDDLPSVIGASLLPFLPASRNETRRSDDATADDFSGSPKRRRSMQQVYQDDFHMDDHIDNNQGFPSLLLHGGVSTISTRGGNQDGNEQQPRRRRTRTRILLRGPSGSGKTSLAMNLACNEAKKDSRLPIGSISAIVYRPDPRSDNPASTVDSSDRFPLLCRPLPQMDTANPSFTNKSESNAALMEKQNQQEDEESWDPNTLSRIRICRVSSLRQLWEDILVLAGKPIEEQPTRAIIIEDLDKMIELEENSSSTPRNQIGSRSGKNIKHNKIVAAMLKTVAIAADTALVLGNSQPQSLRLLITLTTTNSPPQQQRNPPMDSGRRGVAMSGADSSDFLAVASCIDTVVTLYERRQIIEHQHTGMNRNIEDHNLEWKLPVNRTNRSSDDTNKNNGEAKSSSTAETETIVINSLWQAEIQEHQTSKYDHNYNGDVTGSTSDTSFVDYAFVESLPNEDDQHGIGLGDECDGVKELRWKQQMVYSQK